MNDGTYQMDFLNPRDEDTESNPETIPEPPKETVQTLSDDNTPNDNSEEIGEEEETIQEIIDKENLGTEKLLKVDKNDSKQARLIWAIIEEQEGNKAEWWTIFKRAAHVGKMDAKEVRRMLNKYCVSVDKHKGKNVYMWDDKYAVPDLEEPDFPSIDTIIGVKTTDTKPPEKPEEGSDDENLPQNWWMRY